MVPLFLGELGEPQGQEGPGALETKGPTEEVSPHRFPLLTLAPFLKQSDTVGELGVTGPQLEGDPTQTGALEEQPGLEEGGKRPSLPSAQMRSHKPHRLQKHGFHTGT